MSEDAANDRYSAAERLQRTLVEIAQIAGAGSESDAPSLVLRRANIERAASLMIELYGKDARERALLLELRAPDPSFARSVRRRIEELSNSTAAR